MLSGVFGEQDNYRRRLAQKACHTMKYFINYKDEFSSRMLLALVIFLVIFPKTLSSANYSPAGSSQYPHVAPSPSVSHGRSTGVMQEKECFVSRLCEYKILGDNFSCKVSQYVVSSNFYIYAQ